MQINLLRAFTQYQNQSVRAHTIWEDWYHIFAHVRTWDYKHQSRNKSFIIQEMDFKMCRKQIRIPTKYLKNWPKENQIENIWQLQIKWQYFTIGIASV